MQAKKSLGQHFLRCEWVIKTLIQASELTPKDTVLEVGPGTGILTRELAKRAGRVIAVEKDERLADALSASLKKEGLANIHIIQADILDLLRAKLQIKSENLSRLNLQFSLKPYNLQATTYKLVSNIPYYLTSRLLSMLLQQDKPPERIVLTVQKEVAQRVVARPPNMNLLALSVQAYGAPRFIKSVPAACFYPKPKVDSAIISITDISDRFFASNKISAEFFFRVLHACFRQKRKQLRNSLSLFGGAATDALTRASVLPSSRPQELSLEAWASLVKELSKLQIAD